MLYSMQILLCDPRKMFLYRMSPIIGYITVTMMPHFARIVKHFSE